uniref:CCR4-NOT transcription complex subunit 10 n=1 Tax=Spongospora subterranea TaxID=70186 RepID=A0A0H5RN05_9EUKA|eukprot:CRZ10124.1 hypothetical protein [Spongospora subterranea]
MASYGKDVGRPDPVQLAISQLRSVGAFDVALWILNGALQHYTELSLPWFQINFQIGIIYKEMAVDNLVLLDHYQKNIISCFKISSVETKPMIVELVLETLRQCIAILSNDKPSECYQLSKQALALANTYRRYDYIIPFAFLGAQVLASLHDVPSALWLINMAHDILITAGLPRHADIIQLVQVHLSLLNGDRIPDLLTKCDLPSGVPLQYRAVLLLTSGVFSPSSFSCLENDTCSSSVCFLDGSAVCLRWMDNPSITACYAFFRGLEKRKLSLTNDASTFFSLGLDLEGCTPAIRVLLLGQLVQLSLLQPNLVAASQFLVKMKHSLDDRPFLVAFYYQLFSQYCIISGELPVAMEKLTLSESLSKNLHTPMNSFANALLQLLSSSETYRKHDSVDALCPAASLIGSTLFSLSTIWEPVKAAVHCVASVLFCIGGDFANAESTIKRCIDENQIFEGCQAISYMILGDIYLNSGNCASAGKAFLESYRLAMTHNVPQLVYGVTSKIESEFSRIPIQAQEIVMKITGSKSSAQAYLESKIREVTATQEHQSLLQRIR